MIVVLNGYPGVGKLTIGRALALALGGRLLDLHTIYNLAFALTDRNTPAFWNTVDRVEAIAHELILDLPQDQPVILTTVLTNKTEKERQEWAKMVRLGQARPPFCVVHIACDLNENMRRISSTDRDQKRKPRAPEMAQRNHAAAEPLAGEDAPAWLRLDATALTAEASAQAISEWLATV